MKKEYLFLFLKSLLSGCESSNQTHDHSKYLVDEGAEDSIYVVAEEEENKDIVYETNDKEEYLNFIKELED